MMTKLIRLISMLSLVAFASCGGGSGGLSPYGGDAGTGTGGDGNGTGGGSATPSAADLVLTVSAASVANNGTETVVATALAIDSNHNTVAGVPVTVSVDSGVATASGTVTDASGAVTATIGIGSDHSNRVITVSATSGGITKTAQLQVVDSVGGGGTDPSDLLLTLTASTIANDGTESVTANVTALDAKRNVLSGVAVSVSADNGATVQASGSMTDGNGVVSAVIGIGADHSNRTITITATSGGLVRTAALVVADGATTAPPKAADLSLALSSSTLTNGGTSTVTATATAVDSRRNALPGIPVTFSVDANAVAVVSSGMTDANGVVTATIGIGSDRTSRVVTVTATSDVITRSASFSVVGARLTASLTPAVDSGSHNNQIEYKLVDTNALAMANQDYSVTAPGQPSAAGKTDSNGKFVYTYTAPSVTETTTLRIVATSGGETLTEDVQVLPSGGGGVDPATESPKSASLTPSPSVISVNAVGSTANQVELRALFLGANNQPIKNIRVRFDLNGNINSTDGVASQPGDFAYSDSSGVARGTFTPGQIASPTNGITVRACYSTDDFATNTCPNSVTNTLTVTSEALSVNIRTDNTVGEGTAGLTYIKRFVVMVVDAAGQAKQDVQITPSVDLPSYYKGYFAWNGKLWVQHVTLAQTESYAYNSGVSAWQKQGTTGQPSCPNEDVNRNGVREAPVYDPSATPPVLAGRQEDLNWNGDIDPRKADVAIKMVGASTTDANGLAIVQIEYGKNLASWVDFVITVTASGVSGTEARARYSGLLYGVGNLPYPATDVSSETVAPAFVVSPYGKGFVGTTPPNPVAGVCTDAN